MSLIKKLIQLNLILITIVSPLLSSYVDANSSQKSDAELREERLGLYLKAEAITLIPWYYIAAVDQYERNIQQVRKDIPKSTGLSSIYFSSSFWHGELNPAEEDSSLDSIRFFNGHGQDGDGDGNASVRNDEDILYTMAHYLESYGQTEDDFKIALWDYYRNDKAVNQVLAIAQTYQHFRSIDLTKKAFPLPLFHDYTYRSTWGDRRGWGGRRIHEGTDIFASYGVPVRSTAYGVIEVMGWNKYGGWRVGIRDIHNNYHYYAHLSGFNKEVKEGMVVEPGVVLGYVGSSGYGKPGTSGKFPPHLHYGVYKFNGRTEWAYDPYPSLRAWERYERKQKKRG
ncbi:M23 family metallopeptidase [Bacillus horti]|uniref:Murein DD-endopeptidase MepM/ murein hydrolase activator NlpD n=1 Tax=Caldalkalibacillus horti TaxID=77523 RepID=A0ABT9VUA8_9BACI|nr:M23 family metallopeptidase [Bacillus horti]MDQ0164417.1 murein DD-endopeptidase MepM/ murein hydrolase activator NlpD [Bacillus horti]